MKLAHKILGIEEVEETNDLGERTVVVIRDGKRVKKELVRKPVKKKIRTAKQKAGAKKAAIKRKSKQGAINRKRAKSVKKRTGLKKQTNKRLKVREDMKLATKLLSMFEAKKEIGVGKLIKNNAPDLDLAIIKNANLEIFITPNTKLKGFKSIKDIKVGTVLRYVANKTKRGLEAQSVVDAVAEQF